MFGNLLGWLISAVIAAGSAMMIVAYGTPARVSAPSGMLPMGMKSAALSTDPRTVVPPGTDDGDAGELYHAAAGAVKKKARKYREFVAARGQAAKLDAARPIEEDIALLVQAAACARMTLFADRPGEVVNYDNAKPVLPELEQLGNTAVSISGLYYQSDPAKARSYMRAAFALGRNLYEERIVFEEYRIGLALMSNANGMLAQYGTDADDAARVKGLDGFQIVVDGQLQNVQPLWGAISGITADGQASPYNGDLFLFARESDEPLWRVESLLKLGRLRYTAGVGYGDQAGAARLLKQTAKRADVPPAVRAAAAAGRDLSVEKFRMYGGGT